MTVEEFIKRCLERGVPRALVERYIFQTMKDSFTEYDIKAVREAADYEGRLRV